MPFLRCFLLRNHTQRIFFCVCMCVRAHARFRGRSWTVCLPSMPWCLQPHDALPFDCGDDGEVYRVFTDPVILFCDRQNQSIRRPAWRLHIPGTSPHFRIRDHSVIQPNLINKCSSPVPRQSQMKMLLCGTEQSDKDSTAGPGEARLGLPDSFYIPRRRCPSRIIKVPLIWRKSCCTHTGNPHTLYLPSKTKTLKEDVVYISVTRHVKRFSKRVTCRASWGPGELAEGSSESLLLFFVIIIIRCPKDKKPVSWSHHTYK